MWPACGTSPIPDTTTGAAGGASVALSPRSSVRAGTPPSMWPHTKSSPTLRVPAWTSTGSSGPRPASWCGSSTYRGERCMAWCVDEHDFVPVRGLDLVSADALRDAAGLTSGDTRLADGVENRGLAVVDMAEHRDDRRSLDELGRVLVGD